MKASAPGVNLRGSGTDETPTINGFIAENGAPEASKVLNDNGDGTYTLALHVNPQSSEYTITKKIECTVHHGPVVQYGQKLR
jgi:hypothetical protein